MTKMFHDRIQSVNFSLFTSEEIKQLSVKRLTSIEIYDTLGHPVPNGLSDPVLGTSSVGERCASCGQSSVFCPGHFGHVELPLPLYHPMFFQLMLKLLRGSCFTCHRLLTTLSETHLFIRQSELLEKGLLTEAKELECLYNSATSNHSAGSATEIDLQRNICRELDKFYHDVLPSQTESKIKFTNTKNLVKGRLDLINHFIKKKLLNPKKTCPHCKSIQRKIKHEFYARVYFKSVAASAVQKAAKGRKKLSENKNQATGDKRKPIEEEDREEPDDNNEEREEEEEEDEGEYSDQEEEGATKDEETVDSTVNIQHKLTSDEFITAEEVKNHFIQLWNTESKAMKHLLGSHKNPDDLKKVTTPEIFFLDLVMVTPVKFRPASVMRDMKFEHPQTANLSKILIASKLVEGILQRIREGEEEFIPFTLNKLPGQRASSGKTIPGNSYKEQLNNAWSLLQSDVNRFMDSSLDKINTAPNPGVKQLLEKKEGLFRKHMMGKRVNYACRSVISPDPFINTDEIGIPMVFASKLTYPQPVTPLNLKQLEEMVLNGPDVYPGAVMIEFEDGRKMKIPTGDDKKNARMSLAKKLLSSNIPNFKCANKKVYRHLLNGDVMLLNRQPTLHRPSIMAHKAKVLPKERTLRLHYANCKSYNADFDGDEMNAHFPQSELGRAEAYNLVSTNFNYLSPKDGKPLAGLIQDHVISGVRLTSRNTLLEREEYQQLIFNGFIDKPGRITLLPPCILKPKPLWSGKQVFSTILLNIIPKGNIPLNMTGNKAKVSDNNWPKEKLKKNSPVKEITDPFLLESQVIIRGGELMTGILDKTQYGSTAFSLIHCVYEIYGGEIAGKLLSIIARLFTAYLQYTGFTLGVQAILVSEKAEKKRRDIMDEGRQCGDSSAIEAMNLDPDTDSETLKDRLQKAHLTNKGVELSSLDLSMKSRTDGINNKINSVCMRGLIQKFPSNSLQMMVQSGAKGSSVNTMQISCLLGQIELEGRRPPLSMSGRSLPSFQPYDTSPRAGGFVDGRFLTGIRPQEYFFHCMAGREGLIDTAVKTSRSGYLQRCLIKHLEALYVQYDMTVRDGDGSIVQFLYGDDGVDVLKCQYLHDNQFKTVIDNQKAYVSILKPNEVSQVVDLKKAKKIQKKQDKWLQNNNEKPFATKYSFERPSPFLLYEKESRRKVQKKYPSKTRNKYCRTEADMKLFERWYRSEGPTKQTYTSECQPILDPMLSMHNPSCYFGAVSELFRKNVKDYMDCDPDHRLVDDDDDDDDDDQSSGNLPKGGKMSKDAFEPMMMIKYMKSLVQPGEAVGLLAAQSIGEPSTQMTLNTFHFAGRGEMNVTLGIPRLREILMTATEQIRTPQMDVLVKEGMGAEAADIAKILTRLTLMDVLENVSVAESIEKDEAGVSKRQFKIKFKMLPSYAYEDMTKVNAFEILTFMETVFLKKLSVGVKRFIQHQKSRTFLATETITEDTSKTTGEENPAAGGASQPEDEPDDLADLSDEDAENDGGADVMKGRSRRTQFTSYDNPEDRKEELHEDEVEHRNTIEDILRLDDEPSEPVERQQQSSSRPTLLSEDNRKSRALRMSGRDLVDYKYDNESNEWCEATFQFHLNGTKVMMINIVEKLAEKAVLHEAPGIQRAMASKSQNPSDNGRHRLKCEGVNLQELWKYPNVLDLGTLYSNNIHKIAQSYGIEAARSALIKEVQDVFKVYGIAIDPRHLSLIADYMTFEGVYKPFNRHSIETNPFPFQKMSFETSTTFLKSAAAHGLTDELGSPSSRIIVGRVINQGTGMMDLLPKLTV